MSAEQTTERDALPWGEMPYDGRPVAEVIHEYVVVRGDLCEQYARDQLTNWIERYVAELVRSAETDRDRFLRAFSQQFDQREEYEVECKRLWTMEERLTVLADSWVQRYGDDSIDTEIAELRLAILGAPEQSTSPADQTGGDHS